MPSLWALASAWALAGVRVEDPHDCLAAEAVDLEVRSALGDAAVDRLDLLARVEDGAKGWQLSLEVSEAGTRLWDRVIDVQPVDCPFLPALVARSVERGLSDLPGWQVALPNGRLPSELALTLSGSLPFSIRGGLGAAASIGLRRPLRWDVDLEGFLSGVEPVGVGSVQWLGAVLGTGPALEFPAGSDAIRVSVRGRAGPAVMVGGGFDLPVTRVVPRISGLVDLGWVSRGPLRLALRTEVPAIRLVAVDEWTGEKRAEAPIRVGLVLGVAGRLRPGDGGAGQRP